MGVAMIFFYFFNRVGSKLVLKLKACFWPKIYLLLSPDQWIHRETLGIGRDKEDKARTIMGGEPMREAWFGIELVSRLGSQLGSWVQAESILA